MTVDVIFAEITFIWIINNIGPSIVPWGTPEITGEQSEKLPLNYSSGEPSDLSHVVVVSATN